MDERTKLEKVLAMVNDERCHPKMREVAQRILDRMRSNSEIAISPTPAEAYRRYTEAYQCVIKVKVGNVTLPKRCKPEAVCNDKQMLKIFRMYTDWPSILAAMHRCVGGIGNEVLTEDEYARQWAQEVSDATF